MDVEKLIERLYKHDKDYGEGRTQDFFRVCLDCKDAATALSTLQTENKKLRAELEKVMRERAAAVDCIYQIEDDLDRGSDNDWAREHISEWESQKEDGTWNG